MVHQPLQVPAERPFTLEQRQQQIDAICNGFVAPGAANKRIYRVILECLFPSGSGVPGPYVSEQEIRDAVNANYREGYQDVFRRMRELQGEEGVNGIIKQGRRYQLTHLAVGQKREPRTRISQDIALEIALAQGNRCTVCNGPVALDGAAAVDPDHRVPSVHVEEPLTVATYR